MEENIGLIWLLAGIIGFFLNCGIIHILSKFFEILHNRREELNNEKKKVLPKAIEMIIGFLWLIYILGFAVAYCYIIPFGTVVFRTFTEEGITEGCIAIILNIISCIYVSVGQIFLLNKI